MRSVHAAWNSKSRVTTIAGFVSGSAFYIFLLRQFFLGLPRDTFEAARIDGANNWVIFSRIALPLTKPAIVVTLLFEFQAAWTDLMRPLIYLCLLYTSDAADDLLCV